MWNATEFFNKILESEGNKQIIKCKVCNDILYCSDQGEFAPEEFGWGKLENNKGYICHTCLDHHYITQEEASLIDEQNLRLYGTKFIDLDNEHLMRNKLTWDEHQKLIGQYKTDLNQFLKENNLTYEAI